MRSRFGKPKIIFVLRLMRLIAFGFFFSFFTFLHLGCFAQATDCSRMQKSVDAAGGSESFDQQITSLQNYDLIHDGDKVATILILRVKGQRYLRSILSLTHTPTTTIYNGRALLDRYGSDATLLSEHQIPPQVVLKTYLSPEEAYLKEGFQCQNLPDQRIGDQNFHSVLAEMGQSYGTINYMDPESHLLQMIVYPGKNRTILTKRKSFQGALLPTTIINKEEDGSMNSLQLKEHRSPYPMDQGLFHLTDKHTLPLMESDRFGTFYTDKGSKMIREETTTYLITKEDTTEYVTNWKFKHVYSLIDSKTAKTNEVNDQTSVMLVKVLHTSPTKQYLHIYEEGRSRLECWKRAQSKE